MSLTHRLSSNVECPLSGNLTGRNGSGVPIRRNGKLPFDLNSEQWPITDLYRSPTSRGANGRIGRRTDIVSSAQTDAGLAVSTGLECRAYQTLIMPHR